MDFAAAIGQTIDPMRLMQRVTDRTLELIGNANGVMVGLADDREVVYVCGAGHRVSHLGTTVALGSSLSGLAVRTGTLQRCDNTETDPRVDTVACRRLSVASLVCVPLTRACQTLGVLAVNATHPYAFSDDDVATLTRLADFVSVAIGSAWDLSRVSSQLLDVRPPARGVPGTDGSATTLSDTDSRYVMTILSPDTVDRIDSGQRTLRVLDDPTVLSMVFQPIVEVASGAVAAVEALARFDVTPYRPPDVWFREAHDNNLGVELELLAVTHALDQLPRLPHGVALTVNAGPRTAMSAAFADAVSKAPARSVILELTEHTLVDDYDELISSLRALRRRGTRLAIDDTGSGYSSLSHILKLAPDFIKLDRELVSGIDADPVRRALASSLVAFASETGPHIIAEGVETEDELDVLRRLGVRYAQGYHLGRPATVDTVADSAASASRRFGVRPEPWTEAVPNGDPRVRR